MLCLNDDCLYLIFKKLSLNDKLSCEVVCRRFNVLLSNSISPYSNIKEINLSSHILNTFNKTCNYDRIDAFPCIKSISERCGYYLRKVSFGEKDITLNQNSIDQMSLYCPNIRCLDFGSVKFNGNMCGMLKKLSEKLEEISVEEAKWRNKKWKKGFCKSLKDLKNLKTLNLRRISFYVNKLSLISKKLEALQISITNDADINDFNKFLESHKKLKYLEIMKCDGVNEETFIQIGNLLELETLKLASFKLYMPHIIYLSSLSNLSTLSLQNCQVLDGEMVGAINNMNVLKSLELISCHGIVSFNFLKRNLFLEELRITNSNNLCSNALIKLGDIKKLKVLELKKCTRVTNEGICAIILSCLLQKIVISECQHVGDETLFTLSESSETIKSISFQSCENVTSVGISALASLKSIECLKDLDVSYNKNVDDKAIEQIHKELILKDEKREPLSIYVTQTSVSKMLEDKVNDKISLFY